ncbi:MAG TPA: aldo/keto reductase [Pseudolysinimonas sp.]|nr:aldo/keto reductase [Pseudolysinimonas sp.]
MTIDPTIASTPASVLTPREIGTTGLRTFPIAFDGSVLGWVTGVERAGEVLDRFHNAGGTLISTADHYAAGRSEFMIGNWLKGVDRSSVLIATKVGRHPDRPGLGAHQIENSVDASLERLGTEYVDFLSFDGDLLPAEPLEAFEAVDRLIRVGKVRFLSAAHFAAARVSALNGWAGPARYPVFQAVIAEYNLMTRRVMEREMMPLAAEQGIAVFALLPLAAGYLTGSIRKPEDVPSPLFDDALSHVGKRGDRVLAALAQVAGEQEATLATVALAWVLSKPGITAAVVRGHDLDTLDAAFLGSTISLTRHQIALLDSASA